MIETRRAAFTMIELALVVAIVAIVGLAILSSFIASLSLDENSRMMTIAANIARDKLEDLMNQKLLNWDEISSVGFSYSETDLQTDYNFNGSCRIDVDEISSTMKFVRVAVCWRTQAGRIVGTDTNLNGQLDNDEGSVAWSRLPRVINSPVVIVSALARL